MKKIISIVLLFFIMFPMMVFAYEIEDNHMNIIDQKEKYYKTTVVSNGQYNLFSLNNSNNYLAYTEEVSKEEYESFSESDISITTSSAIIETTYKKMTTTIALNGSYYRYKVDLSWKNMPKIRSYDVIAIGHYASVEPNSSIYFSQTYCTSVNNCTTSTSFTKKQTTTGTGAVFKLPTGDLVSLSQSLYFDVRKSVDATVIRQSVVGDYSHAIQTVSSSTASSFEINLNGIYFSNTNSTYFDEINPAIVSWEGTW